MIRKYQKDIDKYIKIHDKCKNLCASQNGTACHNITTEGSQFYLTVYHDEPYVDSELAFINVNEVIPFGKKVTFSFHLDSL